MVYYVHLNVTNVISPELKLKNYGGYSGYKPKVMTLFSFSKK